MTFSYEVTEIELLDGHWITHTQSADFIPTSNNSITATKLLKGVKKNSSNEEILSHSLVIDENGEPKVAEHSTLYYISLCCRNFRRNASGNGRNDRVTAVIARSCILRRYKPVRQCNATTWQSSFGNRAFQVCN